MKTSNRLLVLTGVLIAMASGRSAMAATWQDCPTKDLGRWKIVSFRVDQTDGEAKSTPDGAGEAVGKYFVITPQQAIFAGKRCDITGRDSHRTADSDPIVYINYFCNGVDWFGGVPGILVAQGCAKATAGIDNAKWDLVKVK
jgi:hypothetical protein